jgi:peptidoglycan L-alanyl-D-glutamate endopeptidase CwlK
MTRYLDVCRLGTVSEYNLSSCTPPIQRLIREAIRRAPRWLDFAVTCGHRNEADQNAALAKGASKKAWPYSKHNSFPSKAVDVRPSSPFTVADWNDRLRFARLIGFIECVAIDLDIPIRVGMDFSGDGRSLDETFIDMPHIEEA